MRILGRWALWFVAVSALARQPLWLDLSGPWKFIVGEDRPEFAAVDFDDRAWSAISAPWGYARPIPPQSEGWFRRTVELPDGTDKSQLAITVGTIRQMHEIFVNGQHIGQSSGFDSYADAELMHPHTYRVPPSVLPGNRIQIAIRVKTPLTYMTSWSVTDTGPWLLTDRAIAPLAAGPAALERHAYLRSLDLVLVTISLIIALLSLWAWWSDRARIELLWFALGSATQAFLDLYGWVTLIPGARPFAASGFVNWLVVGELGKPFLAEFVFSVLGYRSLWLRGALWLGWLVLPFSVLLGFSSRRILLFQIGWCAALSLGAIVWNWWTRPGSLPVEQHILRGVILVQPLVALTFYTLLPSFGITVSSRDFHLGPFFLTWLSLAGLLLSVTILSLLLRQSRADQQARVRLSGEIEAARVVQQLLLPAPPVTPDFAVEAVYDPAAEVGGDFYWTRVDPDGALLVVVGDVSGKGLKAAMLVSVAIGILRATQSSSPALVLSALNEGMVGHTGGGFVTCCCARFGAEVLVANAGHPAPYVDGREVETDAGLPLGVMAAVIYAESSARGAAFTFVSDGVVEAENSQRELFGFDRTREISGKSAREIADAAQAWGQNDDITVVTVRRSG